MLNSKPLRAVVSFISLLLFTSVCVEDEALQLLAFKEAVGGNLNWVAGTNCCGSSPVWEGITCDSNQRVTEM